LSYSDPGKGTFYLHIAYNLHFIEEEKTKPNVIF